MANRIIKPDSGNTLVLQDEGGSDALTINTDGECSFAEIATFAKKNTSAYFSSVRSITINNGAVYTVDLNNIGNIAAFIMNARNSAYNTVNCLAQFRKSANAFCDILAQSSNAVEVGSTSTTPTGGSGTSGKVTIFATENENLYIENRKGTTISISLTFFGG